MNGKKPKTQQGVEFIIDTLKKRGSSKAAAKAAAKVAVKSIGS